MDEWDFSEKLLNKTIEITKGEFEPEKWTKYLFKMDELKEVKAYWDSEENLKNCEPFEQLNQKFISLHKKYNGSFNELYKDVESMACRREYAKGGIGLHRGFYSPSLMDLVVGGVNRGRLLKKPPKNGKDIYEYLFDAEDRLICVNFYQDYNGTQKTPPPELFLYEDNKVLSFDFSYTDWNGYEITAISECQHENGELMRYEIAYCNLLGVDEYDSYNKNCDRIQVEIFKYVDDLMKSFCWYEYLPSVHSLRQEKFTFSRDEEGYLSTYKMEQLGGFKPKTKFECESIIYKVRGKRK